MKILLVSLNRETEPFTAAPLGMALVRAVLAEDGHDVRQLDLLHAGAPEKALEEAVRGFGPELVGLSLRNIESSTEFLMPSYRDTVSRIRELTAAPVAVGGPGFSVMPEQALRYLGADYGIKGEGEKAMRRLALSLSEDTIPEGIPGLCRLDGDRFLLVPPESISDLDALPAPSWEGLKVSGYDMLGVQSKRGCSFTCAYCTYPALEGRRMRLRPPSSVAAEIKAIANADGLTSFYFVDNVFNNPRSHALEICSAITRLGLDVSWGCLASPIGLDDELLSAMKRAGCESVEIGADSLSDKALRGIGKPFKAADVVKAVEACKAAGMAHMLFLILGGPDEDEATLTETFNALDELRPDKVFAVAGVRVYPETPVHRLAVKERMVAPDDDLLMPRFYVSPKLGGRLYTLAEDYFNSRPGWIYYRADAISGGRPRPPEGVMGWEAGAQDCLLAMLGEIPRLMRPIAKKAVMRKAGRLAAERGLDAVSVAEVVDSFMEETPGPFRGAMEKSLRRLGLMA